MLQLTELIQDEEMGAAPFVVYRRHMVRSSGETEIEAVEEIVTCGVVQPAKEEDLALTPEEYRGETFFTFYAPITFSLGTRDDLTHFTEPDRIVHDSREFLVVSVKNWSSFGFSRAVAVEKKDG